MTPQEMRGWLLCQPRPAFLRILDGEQKEHRLEIAHGMAWKSVAETVCSLQPESVQCFDDKGALLRAIRPSEVEENDEVAAESGTVEVPADQESARFIIVAKLIAEAYRHSTEVAFDKLANLFDSVVARSNSQEKTITAMDRMLQKMMLEKVAAQAGEEGGSDALTLESLLQGVLSGAQHAKAAQTNGHHSEIKTK